MQVTSLDLRNRFNRRASEQRQRLMHPRDSCQQKIKRLQSAFTIKSHMVINNTEARGKRSLPSKRRCTTSYQCNIPNPPIFKNKSALVVQPRSCLDQSKKDNRQLCQLQRGVSFSLKFKQGTKRGAATSKRNQFYSWHDQNMVDSYLVTDRLTADMRRLKQNRKSDERTQNKSEALFLCLNRPETMVSPSTQHLLYFQREPLMSYNHSKSPELKDLVESQYNDKIEKAVLESQRSVMMKSIKDGVNSSKRSISKLSCLLQTAKLRSIAKVLGERKKMLKDSLIQRKFNPYYSYLTMTKHQKQHFKTQFSCLPKECNNDSDLLENIQINIHKV